MLSIEIERRLSKMPRTKQAANPLILVDIDKLEASRASATKPLSSSTVLWSSFPRRTLLSLSIMILVQREGEFFCRVLGTLSSTAKLSDLF